MTAQPVAAEVKRKRVRRGSLVDPSFQGRFVLFLFLPVAVLTFGLWMNALPLVKSARTMVREVGLRDEAAGDRLRDRLDDAVWRLSLTGVALALSLLAATVAVGITASHRLSGPVKRLVRLANDVLPAATSNGPIVFRRKDHLEELAASFNAADESVRRRKDEVRASLERLCDRANQLESAEGAGEVVKRIEELETILRGLTARR